MSAPPPKPGGNKAALTDAFNSAKAEAGAPDADGPPNIDDASQDQQGMHELEARVQHLTNLLIAKGVISPHDVMNVPTAGAPPLPPPGPGLPPGAQMPGGLGGAPLPPPGPPMH